MTPWVTSCITGQTIRQLSEQSFDLLRLGDQAHYLEAAQRSSKDLTSIRGSDEHREPSKVVPNTRDALDVLQLYL
jgi:hypothetical protein